ncbi:MULTISPECIES: phosphatase PAP2 family protein [unclassified Legionella]|uniref:phosphatase PAP2 family protein n=1 Tax=unclassified Legionella TaxID=2622702 RepID=UPI0010541D06|nr:MULTISPECIES: phosphatase PAP2 family protein [unclassified Legionella]MDI9817694.1 phosphatase PAP2 family protein [Legionella sp. PL877]
MSPFERLLALMTKPGVMLVYVTLVILSFLYLDVPLAEFFYSVDLRSSFPLISWITKLGLGVIYIPSFFLLALFFRYIRQNQEWEARAWFLFMCVSIPGIVCGFLKIIFGRARPALLFENHFYGFYGLQTKAPFWSFPSGHTTTIMGVVFGLSILFPRYCYAFILTGLTVALSRVLLTHHYLSDIMAAGYLTLLEVGILLCFLRRKSWLAPAWAHAV